MLTNLFESFDPSSSYYFSLNWMIMFFILFYIPNLFWILPNRYYILFMTLTEKIYLEFSNLIHKSYKINILMFYTLLMLIMLSNLLSLFPYIFTTTSHMSFNLMLSLPTWISLILFSIKNIPIKLLAHLVPLNTPIPLMNFMVLIELISNLIRPWTLAIRLTANMIAGHLLLTLMGNFILNFLSFMPFSLCIQNMLFSLEISVSFIQSYVFSILMLLYFSETKN